MEKTTYNNAVKLISNVLDNTDKLDSLCHFYGVTYGEVVEVFEDLSLIGFKEKYNQHNHSSNNKE